MTSSLLKETLATEAWRLMLDYLIATSPTRNRSLAQRQLTPNDARALHMLNREKGQAMGALARAWNCDPSMVTWIVTRLERGGLATRVSATEDRRLKLVKLTQKGEKTKNELLAEFRAPPSEIMRLSKDELESVRHIMGKLLEHHSEPDRVSR